MVVTNQNKEQSFQFNPITISKHKGLGKDLFKYSH